MDQKEINRNIRAIAASLEERVISHRRAIHRFAELGGAEYQTHDYICGELDRLGVAYQTYGTTGVIGTLDTGKPGPHIVLRADMDALPLSENANNLSGPRVCISQQPNTCHACGHDAHSAMLLGSIEALLQLGDVLSGTVYFLFEPGEENAYGIPYVLEELSKLQVDTLWGIHVYASLSSGKLSVSAGPRMAGNSSIDVTVHGQGGHGARPGLGKNPVFTAAQIAAQLPLLVTSGTDKEPEVICQITSIQGGESGNVIPNETRVLGTMRWFDTEKGKQAIAAEEKLIADVTAQYGCTASFGAVHGQLGIPLVNDAACAKIAEQALSELLPSGTLTDSGRWYASESMSLYLDKYPGILAFLGIDHPAKGTGAPHHNEYFDVDESVLALGVTATVGYVAAYTKDYLMHQDA